MSKRLLVEIILLYILLPLSVVLCRCLLGSFPVIPVLWVAAIPTAILYYKSKRKVESNVLDKRLIFRELLIILVRALCCMIVLWLYMWLTNREWLWSLPRRSLGLWLIVMCFYPVLSVIPQGIIYRGFFHSRYGSLFKHKWHRILVASLLFSFCHIFFLNFYAIILTFLGGILFNLSYEKTKLLWVSNLEHAIYGDMLFTLGYGIYLYHGSMAMVGA